MRVLVVDDDRLCRMIVEDLLRSWGHEVVCAGDGARAWELLQSDAGFSLVISDWVMPRLDGPELCRRIRRAGRSPYLPVLLTTSLDETQHLVEGLGAGADAFLTKPVNGPALRAQLQVVERILRLEESLAARLRHLEQANERIRRDLEAAAAVQMSHLPRRAPSVPALEFAWVYDACQTLGGDMFNVFRLSEHQVGVYVLDVSGHGTPAALLSVSLSRVLVPDPNQGGILKRHLSEPPGYEVASPAQVAAELNRRFPLLEQSGHYCTLLYGVLDLRTRTFRYASAGHPGPLHVSSRPAVSCDGGGGVPIGVLSDTEYSEEEIQLAPGSQLVLYTDGVNEAANEQGEQFGAARMLALLSEREANGAGVAATVEAIRASLAAFAGGAKPRDDITLVGIGVA